MRNGVHKEAIERARKLPYHLSHKSGKDEEGEHQQQQLQQLQQHQKPLKQQTLWWRLPYHPTIFNLGLKAKLNEVMKKWKDHISDPKVIRISWFNSEQPHMNEVRRIKDRNKE